MTTKIIMIIIIIVIIIIIIKIIIVRVTITTIIIINKWTDNNYTKESDNHWIKHKSKMYTKISKSTKYIYIFFRYIAERWRKYDEAYLSNVLFTKSSTTFIRLSWFDTIFKFVEWTTILYIVSHIIPNFWS